MLGMSGEALSSAIVAGGFVLLAVYKTVTLRKATAQVTLRKWFYFNHGEIYVNGARATEKFFQNRLSRVILIYSVLAVIFFAAHFIAYGSFW